MRKKNLQLELFGEPGDFARKVRLRMFADSPKCWICGGLATMNVDRRLYCEQCGPKISEMGEWDSCGRVRTILLRE